MALHTIIYVSSSVRMMQTDELDELLEQAMSCNAGHGITGMLLYRDGNFMQTLEGDKNAVHELYARIVKDKRHQGLIQLLDEPLASRQFADWSMGFEHIDPQASGRKIPSAVTARAFSLLESADSESACVVLRVLAGFYEKPSRSGPRA